MVQRPDQTPAGRLPSRRTVILGVAASDAHVVANRLIAYHLARQGFAVVNLGPCTPIAAFCSAFEQAPDAEAVLIGSLNGHAYADLRDLRTARDRGFCAPVIVGGNLSVGSAKRASDHERLHELGVDAILGEATEIVPQLDRLAAAPRVAA